MSPAERVGARWWPIGPSACIMAVASALAAMAASGCRSQPAAAAAPLTTVAETRAMLSTFLTLTVVAESDAGAREHIEAGFERIAELDQELSAYRPDSALAAVNAGAARAPVAVPETLYRALEAGVAWHPRTHGAFDITVGPLIGLWRACGQENRLPTENDFARIRPLLGADRILLDPTARTVRFPVQGMRVDLGGLGKGLIADEAVKALKLRGVRSALVAMSGDIYALGTTAGGRPWRIGVQDPRLSRGGGALVTVLELTDRAVSTSGNYERYTEIRGKRYSHIVDPRTGWAADAVSSVTVIGPDTLTTDILDTSLSVLGVGEGLELASRLQGVEALFIVVDEEGELHFTRTPGFAKYEIRAGEGDARIQ